MVSEGAGNHIVGQTNLFQNIGNLSNQAMYAYRELDYQQHGAEAARGAHNPEVTGSRPVAAIVIHYIIFYIYIFLR